MFKNAFDLWPTLPQWCINGRSRKAHKIFTSNPRLDPAHKMALEVVFSYMHHRLCMGGTEVPSRTFLDSSPALQVVHWVLIKQKSRPTNEAKLAPYTQKKRCHNQRATSTHRNWFRFRYRYGYRYTYRCRYTDTVPEIEIQKGLCFIL